MDTNSLPTRKTAHTELLDDPTEEQVTAFFRHGIENLRANYTDPVSFYNAVRYYFNCYGYAAGSIGNGFMQTPSGMFIPVMAVPGALSGHPMEIFTPEELRRAVVADGFDPLNPEDYAGQDIATLQRPGYTLVASFLKEENPAFHFAVRGKDGEWTHKNGSSAVIKVRIGALDDNTLLRTPHEHPEDYLGPAYTFAGYYWRPDEGINVIAGDTPVTAFDHDGNIVRSGFFDPETMKKNIWIGARGDTVSTSFEIKGFSLHALKNGGYGLSLTDAFNNRTQVTLPDDYIFNEYNEDGRRTGNKTIDLNDPEGPNMKIVIYPDNRPPSLQEIPSLFPKPPATSPFGM